MRPKVDKLEICLSFRWKGYFWRHDRDSYKRRKA